MTAEDLLAADLIDELSAAAELRASIHLASALLYVEERIRDEIRETTVS